MNNESASLDNLASTLVGVSGEYFVAAELSRQGYLASLTLRNTRGVDVLAASPDASRSVAIQVKTNRSEKKHWILHEKAEKFHAKNLFYVFVNLKGPDERPAYHVVPSKIVARYVEVSHRSWRRKMRRDGKPHRDSTMRIFSDEANEYLDKWKSLKLDKVRAVRANP